MLFSKRLTSTPLLVAFLQTTIQGRNCPDFQAELFLVHSPLLKESYLVSFPPLTYMLKFSRFASLTSCLEKAFAKELYDALKETLPLERNARASTLSLFHYASRQSQTILMRQLQL